MRHPAPARTLVARTCASCGRVALDVLALPSGDRCYSGVGCQREDRARAVEGTAQDLGRRKRDINCALRRLRRSA